MAAASGDEAHGEAKRPGTASSTEHPTPPSNSKFLCCHGEDDYGHDAPGLIYCTTSFPGSSINELEYTESQITGCNCTNSCSVGCACISRSGHPYRDRLLTDSCRPIFECNDECSCNQGCPNRLVQTGPVQGLQVVPFARKGLGVRTSYFIPRNSHVCEYAGEFISVKEAQKRFSEQTDNEPNYILVIREHFQGTESQPQITIIDPTVVGNIGRYINHSCQPNLKVVPVRINNMVPVAALFSTQDIKPGEELCYDYNATDRIAKNLTIPIQSLHQPMGQASSAGVGCSVNKKLQKPCLCKSPNCLGYLPVSSMLF